MKCKTSALIAWLLFAALLLSPVAFASAEMDAVIDDFIENFRFLAATPHQSQHEQAASDALKAWAESLDFEVRQNDANDLFFDVPATEGYEGLPLVALQAHIDMVCVAEKGLDFDPLTDPITVVVDRDAGTMTADGTSLGADDSAGVALIMSIVKGLMAHGPLRIVFTTDEEVDMTGALAVTAEDLEGVKYLINIDSEESDTVTVSTAADSTISVTGSPASGAAVGDLALSVSVSGLLGGHSGMMIGEGRCNAIRAVAEILNALNGAMPMQIAAFQAGTADNAIPSEAEAVIALASDDRALAERIIDAKKASLVAEYAETDPGLTVAVAEAEIPEAVLSRADTDALIDYLCAAPDGVYTMSAAIDGLVESSSNLGIVDATPDGIEIRHMPRSSEAARLTEIEDCMRVLATVHGYAVDIWGGSRAWPVKTDSALVPAIQEIYRELNGEEIQVVALHAGIECGAFSELSPDLDMASIGPDITDAHSPEETLYLNSIQNTWSLLEKLLATLS